MKLFYILLALVAGVCAPTQAGINSQLRLWTNDPVFAAMISFAVGTVALLFYVLLLRIPWPALKIVFYSPWWIWTGGFLGAFLVAASIILVPKLGAATMLGIMVAGQMVAGVVLDHFGLVGYEVHPANLWRCLGALLVVCGVVIVKRF
ncbi:MAG: DMT family transporter [Desulfomonilaceae bacterium]